MTISGLLGDSDREGRRRLYLNTRLDYYAEFRSEDVVAVEDIGPDVPPFTGLDATRVTLARDATVDYVRSQVGPGPDPFAVDALARSPQGVSLQAETWEAECPGPSFFDPCQTDFACGSNFECPSGWTVCKPATCRVTERATCDTCRTCDDATCQTCRGATCVTCQGTCRTCNQATCQATCANTCVNTCANTCGNTCAASCNGTCVGRTCIGFTCNDFGCGPTFAQTHCFTCRTGCN